MRSPPHFTQEKSVHHISGGLNVMTRSGEYREDGDYEEMVRRGCLTRTLMVRLLRLDIGSRLFRPYRPHYNGGLEYIGSNNYYGRVKSIRGFSYGWWVLIACGAIQLYFAATFVSGFTALFNPIVNEFGWSYFVVSMASVFRGFQMGFMAPLIGYFVDRLHTRNLLLIGCILGAIGFYLLSLVESVWTFYACFILLGISLSLTSQVVIFNPITKWFRRKTSLALGIVTAGAGLAGLLIPAIVLIVDNFGWRIAVQIFAAGAILICTPLCFLVKDAPGDQPLLEGETRRTTTKTQKTFTTRQVLKMRNFWALSLAILFSGFASSAITAHQIPYLVTIGMNREMAGWMVVLYAVSSIIGRLGFGWLGDRLDRRFCFMLVSAIQAGGLTGFAFSTSFTPVIISLLFMGIGLGGVMPIRAVVQIEFFGLQNFAVIQGLSIIFVTVGTMAAAPAAGWIYDVFQNYQPAWIIFAILSFFTIPVLLATSKKKPAPRAAL
jgi:MFS family permease